MLEKQKKIRLCSFSQACVLSFSIPVWFPLFLELGGGTYLDISVGGGRSQTDPAQGRWQVLQACQLAALPPGVLGVPLCRQGTSLLVCVIGFVHIVLCMIFVRLRSRGGVP